MRTDTLYFKLTTLHENSDKSLQSNTEILQLWTLRGKERILILFKYDTMSL